MEIKCSTEIAFAFVEKEKKAHVCYVRYGHVNVKRKTLSATRHSVIGVSDFIFRFSSVGFIKG